MQMLEKKDDQHFFHRIKTNKDDRIVYLGSKRSSIDANLRKIKLANIRSGDSLISKLEGIQHKLAKLGHFNRNYDDIMKDIRINHVKNKAYSDVAASVSIDQYAGYSLVAVLGVAAGFGIYSLFSSPSITGAVVQGSQVVSGNSFVSISASMFVLVVLMGILLHAAQYRHEHRYDKYKPPR